MKQALAIAALGSALSGEICLAQQGARAVVVPNVVIYPGEIVRPDAVRQILISEASVRELQLAPATEAIGRIATVTLLPNEPVAQRMLRLPPVIQLGAVVTIRYERPGLSISASGTALQPGVVGEKIRVKNLESAAIIVGVVQESGSVQVVD